MNAKDFPRITGEELDALIARVEIGGLLSNPLTETEYAAIEYALKYLREVKRRGYWIADGMYLLPNGKDQAR